MMAIPVDLPAFFAPLVWMSGIWKGWGMYSGFDEAEDFAVIEEITRTICGEQMLLTISIYRGAPKAGIQINPVWDAATGLANIAYGDLIFEESMYVSVLPGSGIFPKPGEYMPREFIAISVTTNAPDILWAGADVGPRVQMVSDAIARGAGAQEVEHLGRMYGLVAGELMWTQEHTLTFSEAEVEMSGRLMRVAQVTTESSETVEEIDTRAEGGFGE